MEKERSVDRMTTSADETPAAFGARAEAWIAGRLPRRTTVRESLGHHDGREIEPVDARLVYPCLELVGNLGWGSDDERTSAADAAALREFAQCWLLVGWRGGSVDRLDCFGLLPGTVALSPTTRLRRQKPSLE